MRSEQREKHVTCLLIGKKPLGSLLAVCLLLGFIILSIAGCAATQKSTSGSPPPDQVVSARSPEEVKKLREAVEPYVRKARETYPGAKKRFLKGLPQGHHFLVTVEITDQEEKTEQVFVFVSSIEDGKIRGRIGSDITLISGYRRGDAYETHESQIRDWTILRPDGSEEGNYVGKFLDTYPCRNQEEGLEARARTTMPSSEFKEAHAHFIQGNLYLEERQYDQAISEYAKPIKLDPELAVAWYNLGIACQR